MNKAVFIDRDGTLNVDHGNVYLSDDFHFIEGSIEALQILQSMGYLLVVVTNQSGIAKGLYTEEQFVRLTEWMDWSLADRGIDLDGIYFCPHHANDNCDCRKPKSGMLLDAAKELNIDLRRSFMVGDAISDLKAGKSAKVKQTILVESGQEVTEEARKKADAVLSSIAKLPEHIKKIIK